MTDDADLDPFNEPKRHMRRAYPPWSSVESTVCGRPLADVKTVLEWEDAEALVRRVGKRRAEFLFCQTCLSRHAHRADAPRRWDTRPESVVADYAERGAYFMDPPTDPVSRQVRAEILALADLVAEHRDDYDQAVARRLVPDALAEHRASRRKRGARR